MQPDFETYLHRIGRTGRFGKSGLAINMVDGNRSRNVFKAIEKHFGKTVTLCTMKHIRGGVSFIWRYP